MELDERDLSHLRYIATLYANQPWEVGAILNVFRLGTGRSDDDPLMQVLIQIDKECEKPDSTILSVANSLLESSCPNCKHAGEIFLTTWKHWAQRTAREAALAKAGFEPVSNEQRANNMAVNMLGLECDRAKMGK